MYHKLYQHIKHLALTFKLTLEMKYLNFSFQDFGPPERVICLGEMTHTCQEDLVMKVTQTDVPYFNAPIYLENKEQVKAIKIGKLQHK